MRRTTQFILHTPLLAIADVVLVNLGVFLAVEVLYHIGILHYGGAHPYLRASVRTSIAAFAILYVSDLYSGWLRKSKTDLTYSIALSTVILAVATMALSFWTRQFSFPRSVILVSAVLQFFFLFVFRLAVRRAHLAQSGVARAMLIAGGPDSAEMIASQINQTRQDWIRIEEIILTPNLVRMYKIYAAFDTVVVASDVRNKADIADFCAAHNMEVMFVPEFFEFSIIGAQPLQIDDILLLNVKPPHLSPGQRALKRTLDLLGALAGIILASPFLIILPILIRMTSKGPALFRQERLGRGGEEFTLYKFRSMRTDAEKSTGPVLATENDPRITRLGKFLRETRLDELPQLFNILSGEMSLVGPRPERAHFVREFFDTVPSYQYRMSVKPGITGLAQVYGRYSTTAARKLRFDLMYIYDYSLVLDLKILLKTIQVVFKREQAAGVATRRQDRIPGEEVIFTK